MASAQKSDPILVVGAGTFGLSTAWHLVKRGYTSVKCIDRHPAPSAASAGYDLNKIFRTEYSDPFYSRLAVEARTAWLEEPILQGCYHESGYIFSVCGRTPSSVQNYEEAVANSRALGVQFEDLTTPEDFRAKAPFLDGPMEGWKGVYNPKAGWTHARDALQAVAKECARQGVEFVSGPSGTMKDLVLGLDGAVLGVQAEDGTIHSAHTTVLATGAWTDSLIDTGGQYSGKTWCFAHIKLTEEEAARWRGAPVVNNRELGFMFEPDAEGRYLKVAPHTQGYTHFVAPSKSVPRSKPEHPTDTIPDEAASLMRDFLRECLGPKIANRPFAYEQMCWDADSPDAHFVLTRHPDHSGLAIAGAGSGHGFKFLPTIGGKVVDLLEGSLPTDQAQAWKWRPGQEPVFDSSRPPRPPADLKDLPGWKHDEVP